MDKTLSQEHDTKVFNSLNASYFMTLVPMNSNYDNDGTIKSYFYDQNAMLRQTKSIRVDNLKGVDIKLTEKDQDM